MFIDFHLCENKVRHSVRFFPYVMYTVRGIDGMTRWAEGIFLKKLNLFIKYQEEYKLSHQHLKNFQKSGRSLDEFYKARIRK